MIDVRGSLTFDDRLAAHRAHARKSTLILSAVVVVVSVAIFFYSPEQNKWVWIGALAAYVSLVRPALARMDLRREWQQMPPSKTTAFNAVFDEHGIHTVNDEGETIDQSWQGVERARETADMVLLYFSPTVYLFVPKRLITGDELLKLRSLIHRRVEER